MTTTRFTPDEFFNKWRELDEERKKYPPEPIENLESITSPELREHLEFIESEHIGYYVEILDANVIHVHNYHGAGFDAYIIVPFYKEGFQLIEVQIEKDDDIGDDWNDGLGVTLKFVKLGELIK